MKDVKDKVLKELIEEMDNKILEGLKNKSPKFMKVETNDPELAEETLEKISDKEMPSEQPEDDEDLERLKAMYENLK